MLEWVKRGSRGVHLEMHGFTSCEKSLYKINILEQTFVGDGVSDRSLSSVLVSIENQITSVERHLAGFEKVRLATVTGKVPG